MFQVQTPIMENWWSLSGIYNYIVGYFWPPGTQQPGETSSTSSNDQTNRLKETPAATEIAETRLDSDKTRQDLSRIDKPDTEKTKLDTDQTRVDTTQQKDVQTPIMENWWSLSGIYNYIVGYFWPPGTKQSKDTTSTSSNDETNRKTKQTPLITETPSRAETRRDTDETTQDILQTDKPDIEKTELDTDQTRVDTAQQKDATHQKTLHTQKTSDAQNLHDTPKLHDIPKIDDTQKLDDFGIVDVTSTLSEATSESQSQLDLHLKENPFVAEISQIPQLCELETVTQLVQESGNTHDFSSLTSCFRYIINLQGSDSTSNVREIQNTLYKWTYKILKSGKAESAWTNLELVDEIGQDCFEYCQQTGTLVDTKFHIDDDNSNPMLDGYKMVAKIFCEWFVAHYVKHIAEDRPGILDKTLQAIDPGSHQFVYRFACGLSNICATKILKYLEKDESWKELAILCMVEQPELAEDFESAIRRLCSTINEIKDEDSALMERSKLQLMKVASWKKIPIKEILLMGCFSSLDLQLETIVLKSDQELPKGLSVKELRIQLEENLTTKHVVDVLHFATKCEEMETLGFDDCNEEIPIDVIDSELLEDIRSKGLQVEWFSRNKGGYQLNLESGIFEHQQED